MKVAFWVNKTKTKDRKLLSLLKRVKFNIILIFKQDFNPVWSIYLPWLGATLVGVLMGLGLKGFWSRARIDESKWENWREKWGFDCISWRDKKIMEDIWRKWSKKFLRILWGDWGEIERKRKRKTGNRRENRRKWCQWNERRGERREGASSY